MNAAAYLPSRTNAAVWLAGAIALTAVRLAGAADYPTTILGDNPLAYYRLEETSGTTATDSSANGSHPGVYVPNGAYPMLGQLGIDVNSIGLSAGTPSSMTAGYYDDLNQPSAFSFELWARPISTSATDYRCPIGNFSGWAVANVSGWYVYQTPGTPATFAFIMQPNGSWISQAITPLQWYHLVGTWDGTNAAFYINGNLVGTQAASGYQANSINNAGIGWLGIGQRGDNSQYFDGNVDEVAYYTNVLTAQQVLTHYQVGTNSFRVAAVPPTILTDVISTNAYAGTVAHFSVQADGTAPLSYQWYRATFPIPDATNNAYSFRTAAEDDGATFKVVVTNIVGSVTSSVATLSVSTGLVIDAQPSAITRNVGSSAVFEVVAEGAVPISYQWRDGAGSPIPGATNAWLWLTNLQAAQDGNYYYVSVINSYTSVDSSSAMLGVQARPVNVPVTGYAKIIVADGPVAYWRLDETSGSMTAVDAVGSFDGAYTPGTGSFQYGVPTGIPHETDSALGLTNGATINVPYAIEINPPGAFSVDGWFNAGSVPSGPNDYRTAISSMSNPYGIGPTGWLVYQTAANNWSWWPYNGYYTGVQLTDPDQIVPGQWYYLALTYDGNLFTLYVNGVAKASGTDPGFVQNGNVPPGGSANYNYNYNTGVGLPIGSGSTVFAQRVDNAFNPFSGAIDDIAVYNKALTPQQVKNHYLNTVSVGAALAAGKLVVTWPVGTLQSASTLTGSYTDVPAAISPYTNTISGTQRYFRIRL